jgi:hypothetical protein
MTQLIDVGDVYLYSWDFESNLWGAGSSPAGRAKKISLGNSSVPTVERMSPCLERDFVRFAETKRQSSGKKAGRFAALVPNFRFTTRPGPRPV